MKVVLRLTLQKPQSRWRTAGSSQDGGSSTSGRAAITTGPSTQSHDLPAASAAWAEGSLPRAPAPLDSVLRLFLSGVGLTLNAAAPSSGPKAFGGFSLPRNSLVNLLILIRVNHGSRSLQM